MLIATYYLLLKNWDIFATRPCISLIINIDYFRGGNIIEADKVIRGKNIGNYRTHGEISEMHVE